MNDLIVPAGITDVKPIREIIFEYLRQVILDGVIKPGDRLVERDIAAKFNVSRTPVREALRKLESEGYVEYIPRKGDVVRGFNAEEIEEIYDIRKALECLAVRKAIKNISEHETERLKTIIEQLDKDEKGDGEQTFKGLHDFDELILNTAKMPMVSNFVHVLQESLVRYRKINLSHEPRRKVAIKEHRAILKAIIDRDVERAEQLIALHIDNAREELLKGLKRE